MISIVIPAKDEEKNIGILLERLRSSFRKIKDQKFEIIVVCDNCIDDTEKVVRKFGLKPLVRRNNPGKSKALVHGFRQAKGNILVMMDADLSHLPKELPSLVSKLLSDSKIGLVVASRELGKSDDTTPIRRFGGLMFNFWVNFFFQTKLSDAINGYKIFYRRLFDNFDYTADGYAIEIELVANAVRMGMEVAEIPSYEAQRASGLAKSKVVRDGWLFLKEIFTEGIAYKLEGAAKWIKKL